MGYGKDDELAINTIRLLAVWQPHHEPIARLLFEHAEVPIANHTLVDRSMPPSKRTQATLAPQWAWPRWPMYCSINS